jgi:hypothetical protein
MARSKDGHEDLSPKNSILHYGKPLAARATHASGQLDQIVVVPCYESCRRKTMSTSFGFTPVPVPA